MSTLRIEVQIRNSNTGRVHTRAITLDWSREEDRYYLERALNTLMLRESQVACWCGECSDLPHAVGSCVPKEKGGDFL